MRALEVETLPKRSDKQESILEKLRRVDPELKVRWDEKTVVPRRLQGNLSKIMRGTPETMAKQFLGQIKDLYRISNAEKEFKLMRVTTDHIGVRHVRLKQEFKGLPVFGAEVIVHIDSENIVRGVNGQYFPVPAISTTPKISSEEAIKTAQTHANVGDMAPIRPPRLVIFALKTKPKLVWHMTLPGKDGGLDKKEMPAEWECFIDAKTGAVTHRYNNIQTQDSFGSGIGLYSGDHDGTLRTYYFTKWETYLLRDRSRPGTQIMTCDLRGGYDYTLQLFSEDGDNYWINTNQAPREDSQEAEVDAHFYAAIVYEYFLSVHQRNSFDGAGANFDTRVHYGQNYNNAFYSPAHDVVALGDGDDSRYNYLCSLDMIAHEWTHAFVSHMAGLVYEDESGALNESLADFFACMIDENWLIGEDCWLETTAPALRNFADPTNGGNYDSTNPTQSAREGHQPDHIDDKYTGTFDNGGVHINSGIMNTAAYLITVGGTHRGINICGGLGRQQAAKLYFEALLNHFTSNTDFEGARDALLDACDTIFPASHSNRSAKAIVTNAFAAVGIGEAVNCPVRVVRCTVSPTFEICPKAPYIPVTCPLSPAIIECQRGPKIILECPGGPSFGTDCPPGPTCLAGPDPVPNIIRKRGKPFEPKARRRSHR